MDLNTHSACSSISSNGTQTPREIRLFVSGFVCVCVCLYKYSRQNQNQTLPKANLCSSWPRRARSAADLFIESIRLALGKPWKLQVFGSFWVFESPAMTFSGSTSPAPHPGFIHHNNFFIFRRFPRISQQKAHPE